MLHPPLVRARPSNSQRICPDASTYGNPGMYQPHRPQPIPVLQGSWKAHDLLPDVQDFVVPKKQISDGIGVSPQLGTKTTGPIVSGVSDLMKLPFFRQVVMASGSKVDGCSEALGKSTRIPIKTENTEMTLSKIPETISVGESALNYTQAAGCFRPMERAPEFKKNPNTGPPAQQALIHVQSVKSPHAIEVRCPYRLPNRFVLQLPKVLVPANPALVQSVLRSMAPAIVYAAFECDEGCRSRGICVHFSFVLGCRQAPDGLICQLCRDAQVEKGYIAQRICAAHNKRSLSQFTMNLPEDILATALQVRRASEILMRFWQCKWEGVPSKTSKARLQAHSQGLPSCSFRAVGGIRRTEFDAAMTSIEVEDHDSPGRPLKKARRCANFEAIDVRNVRDKGHSLRQSLEVTVSDHERSGDNEADRGDDTPRARVRHESDTFSWGKTGMVDDTNHHSVSLLEWS